MPTVGCAPFTASTVTVTTLSGLRWPVMICLSYLITLKVHWRLRRLTQYLCTSVWERGVSRRDRFTGGDFRSVGNSLSWIAFFWHSHIICKCMKFKFPKQIGGQKRAKFGAILDNFKLRSRISPERVKISKIGKRVDRERFLPRSKKKVQWTLVH